MQLGLSEQGDILMRGRDEGADAFFGDSSYDYIVTIRSKHREQLGLALETDTGEGLRGGGDRIMLQRIHDTFSREPDPAKAFMGWLKRRGVPYEFDSGR